LTAMTSKVKVRSFSKKRTAMVQNSPLINFSNRETAVTIGL
jgi:hypothetical protein